MVLSLMHIVCMKHRSMLGTVFGIQSLPKLISIYFCCVYQSYPIMPTFPCCGRSVLCFGTNHAPSQRYGGCGSCGDRTRVGGYGRGSQQSPYDRRACGGGGEWISDYPEGLKAVP